MKKFMLGFAVALFLTAAVAFTNTTGVIIEPFFQLVPQESLPDSVGEGTLIYQDHELRIYGEDGWKIIKQFNH